MNGIMRIPDKLTAIIEKHGSEYIGYIEEIPGVNTQGVTIDEARENLKDALKMIIEEAHLD